MQKCKGDVDVIIAITQEVRKDLHYWMFLFYMPTGDYWIENIDSEIRYIQIIAADSNTDRQQFDKLGLCIQV